jgi:hypothetical protein
MFNSNVISIACPMYVTKIKHYTSFFPYTTLFRSMLQFFEPVANTTIFSVDKKNQLDVTFVFFISLLIVAQHVSGNHVPIIRS